MTKNTSQSSIKRYPTKDSIFTTGAYIERFSYLDSYGNVCFGWIVTGFEDDTYRDGEYLDVEPYANTLEELTPDEEEEKDSTPPGLRIIQMLVDYEADYLELDEHFVTSSGAISEVGVNGFEYSCGETDDYDSLDDEVLEDLAYAVEIQIEANEKIFLKSQGL